MGYGASMTSEGGSDMPTTYPYVTGRVLTVDRLKFTVKSPQVVHDPWRGTDRTCRFYGPCAYCHTWTYAFDDGENDPRGMLGDHASSAFDLADNIADDEAREVRRVGGVELPACFTCMNEYDRYQWFIETATRIARRRGADI